MRTKSDYFRSLKNHPGEILLCDIFLAIESHESITYALSFSFLDLDTGKYGFTHREVTSGFFVFIPTDT